MKTAMEVDTAFKQRGEEKGTLDSIIWTVGMRSTGTTWRAVFQVLESHEEGVTMIRCGTHLGNTNCFGVGTGSTEDWQVDLERRRGAGSHRALNASPRSWKIIP